MQAIHWAGMHGVPSEVTNLLAGPDGSTFGYGYGPGWAMVFGSEQGDVSVEPGQWIVKHDDGSITVEDEEPES